MSVKLLNRSHRGLKLAVGLMALITLGGPIAASTVHAHAASDRAYDLSEFQGYLTPTQVEHLKNEVGFVILRAQYGGNYRDSTFEHNVKLMQEYHVPYGVYSYSLYANSAQARQEADQLHSRAPEAKFYVNDMEQNNAGDDLNEATQAWSDEIHKISDRPAILYSGLYFMNTQLSQQTRNTYNALWLAAYGSEPDPSYHYDLWQFSSNFYSQALGQSLDADTFPDGNNKPLSFWIGNNSTNPNAQPQQTKSTIKPLNPNTGKAVTAAKKAANFKKQANDADSSAVTKKLKRKARIYKAFAERFANSLNAENQEISGLKTENDYQSAALQKENQEVNDDDKIVASDNQKVSKDEALIHKLENEKNSIKSSKPSKATTKKPAVKKVAQKKLTFDPNYYRFNGIHYLKVTSPGGINIYNNNGAKLAHVKKGTIIHVLGFRRSESHGHIITRAIGDYGWNRNGSARQVVFTSNKSYVHWYK